MTLVRSRENCVLMLTAAGKGVSQCTPQILLSFVAAMVPVFSSSH